MSLPDMTDFWGRFNGVDVGIVIITLRAGYVGSKRGFIPELTTLVGFLTALVLSLQHKEETALLFARWVSLPLRWQNLLAEGVLFTGIYIIFRIIRSLISKLFHLEGTGTWNRLSGALLGLLRGGFLYGVLLVILLQISSAPLKKEVQEKSFFGSYLVRVIPVIYESSVRVYPFRTTTGSLTADLY